MEMVASGHFDAFMGFRTSQDIVRSPCEPSGARGRGAVSARCNGYLNCVLPLVSQEVQCLDSRGQ